MGATKVIRVSENTYRMIAKLGTLEDSFDSVLKRLASDKIEPGERE